jgi:hypothetical protein
MEMFRNMPCATPAFCERCTPTTRMPDGVGTQIFENCSCKQRTSPGASHISLEKLDKVPNNRQFLEIASSHQSKPKLYNNYQQNLSREFPSLHILQLADRMAFVQ